MGLAFAVLGAVIVLAIIGVVIAAIKTSSMQADQKLRRDMASRRTPHQPWDAHGASGRGLR